MNDDVQSEQIKQIEHDNDEYYDQVITFLLFLFIDTTY